MDQEPLEDAVIIAGVEQDLTYLDWYVGNIIETHREISSDYDTTTSLLGLASTIHDMDKITILGLLMCAVNRIAFPMDQIDLEQLNDLPLVPEPSPRRDA